MGDWTFGLDGGKSDYCLITGDGGDIMSCDRCQNSFLIKPLENWYGKEYVQWLDDHEDEEFACFKCDDSKDIYKKFTEASNKIFEKLKPNSPKGGEKERHPSSTSKTKIKSSKIVDSDSTSTLGSDSSA